MYSYVYKHFMVFILPLFYDLLPSHILGGRPPTQPPDAENRTSGGVEGSRGANPVSSSAHEPDHRASPHEPGQSLKPRCDWDKNYSW